MEKRTEKLDEIFLWLVLAGGFFSFLIYGLSYFTAKPTVETITTHSSLVNSNANMTDIKFQKNTAN